MANGIYSKTMWSILVSDMQVSGTVSISLPQLAHITLLINGEFDKTVEYASAPYLQEIPKVKWVFLSNSSHMGMWEERERLMRLISESLASKA